MTTPYFLAGLVGSGAAGAGAGAGVAAAAGGAGASAGFSTAFSGGFGASFALHPIPMAAKLITKTSAIKSIIHFLMFLHLLSD
jgi:hypothetical protein